MYFICSFEATVFEIQLPFCLYVYLNSINLGVVHFLFLAAFDVHLIGMFQEECTFVDI